ncbi:MAG: DUF4376 domain-containing protein [Acidaminococcaceae bacterium]|nr:DUF4376 domain-containing protein [Acidaminococcaceae bacterium]
MDEQFLIKFDKVTGERQETYPIDNDITPERMEEMLADGFEIISRQDWELLIGNVDGKEHVKDVKNGGYKEKPPYVPALEEAKKFKVQELKTIRNTKELEPVVYNGHRFDFDKDSIDRLHAATITMTIKKVTTINWTSADHEEIPMTVDDLQGVIAAGGMRSNELHGIYRTLKAQVEGATSVEEVEAIQWPEV